MGERAEIALQVVIVLAVLAAAVFGIVTSVAVAPPPTAAATPTGPDASLIASTVRSPIPTPSPTPAPTFVTLPPSPTPTPSPTPLTGRAVAFQGRTYHAVAVGAGTTFLAPFDATVEIHLYQFVDGEIREGANAQGLPYYPYVILSTADRRLRYRPGALDRDVELIAKEGTVAAGAPLFRVIGDGPSSWRTFYDASLSEQLVVSLDALPSGEELDPIPLLRISREDDTPEARRLRGAELFLPDYAGPSSSRSASITYVCSSSVIVA